jgi:hypothetical protein
MYRRIIRLEGTPITLARGIGIGVIIGCLVPPGGQILAVVPLAILLRGNVVTAIAGTFISNPFTFGPLYAFNCHVGAKFLDMFDPKGADITEQVTAFIDAVGELRMLPMLRKLLPIMEYWITGGLIVGLASSVPAYYATYLIVIEVRKFRDRRHAQRLDRLRARRERCPRPPEYDEEAPDEQPPPPAE